MQNYRSIARTAMFLIAFVCATAAAALPDAMEPMAAVRQYVDAFNKGDVEAMSTNCADAGERTRWTGATRLARTDGLPGLVPRRVGCRRERRCDRIFRHSRRPTARRCHW